MHTCNNIENSDKFVLMCSDEDRHCRMRDNAINLCCWRAVWCKKVRFQKYRLNEEYGP